MKPEKIGAKKEGVVQLQKKLFVLLSVALLIVSLSVAAEELSGQEILSQLKEGTTITGSGSAVIRLLTENDKGEQRVNKLKIFRKVEGNVEKQLLEYLEPADVEGTKFLSITDKEADEQQMWLYLPVIGRERRITGSSTQENFMNTDFTYEEIGGGKNYDVDYQAERLADEEFNGLDCYLLRLQPKEEDSDYSYLMMWVWKQEMTPVKIEFYNQDGQLSKKLITEDFTEQDDGKMIPGRIIMSDELAGTRTIIEILESSEEEVDDDYFTMRYLRRE